MHINLKIVIAVLLVCSSLGVVGYNYNYFMQGTLDEDTSTSPSSPFAGLSGEDFEEKESLQVGSGNTTWSDDSGDDSPSAIEKSPLGSNWTDTPWHELVSSYMNQSEGTEDKITASDEFSTRAPLLEEDTITRHRRGIGFDELDDSLNRIEVRGVIVGTEHSLALINGWILHEGDALPGEPLYIDEIKNKQIVFKAKGSDWVGGKRLESIGDKRKKQTNMYNIEEGESEDTTIENETETP